MVNDRRAKGAWSLLCLGAVGSSAFLLYLGLESAPSSSPGPATLRRTTADFLPSVIDDNEPITAEDENPSQPEEAATLVAREIFSVSGDVSLLSSCQSTDPLLKSSVIDCAPKQGPPLCTAAA